MLDGLEISDTITAERLTLRPPRRRDAGMMSMYLGDARVARELPLIPHPYPPGAAENMIERALGGKRSGPLYVMDATPSDGAEFVGLVFVNKADDKTDAKGVFQISYMVGTPFRQTGYASEAVAAARDALFRAGASALVARVFQDNDFSAHVLTRAGFAYVGEGETFSAARNSVAPTWRYRLERETWRELTS